MLYKFSSFGEIRLSRGQKSSTWGDNKGNIKTSAKKSVGLCKLKQHKLWLDEECSRYLDQRKHAKIQWLHDLNQSNADNINTVKREADRFQEQEDRISEI
jgi:hypothetical protein